MVNQLRLGDISVDVVLKDIKNVHLSVQRGPYKERRKGVTIRGHAAAA